jgi:hypothetical protein
VLIEGIYRFLRKRLAIDQRGCVEEPAKVQRLEPGSGRFIG